jgi:hypothetical protein
MEDGVWFFDSGSKLSDDELIQLLHRAAGSHANSYSLRANKGWVGATVLTSTPYSRRTLKGEPNSVTHVEALYRRLWQLLPAEKFNAETDRATVTVKKVGLHGAEPGEYQISVILEAGLWKVDSLLDWSDTKMVFPATITLPKAAAEKILRAVRERNGGKQRFDAKLSRSTKESMTDQERGLFFQDLGDLAMDLGEVENLGFEEKWLDETTAEVVIIRRDDPKRRWTFRMVFEDGTWKLNDHGP